MRDKIDDVDLIIENKFEQYFPYYLQIVLEVAQQENKKIYLKEKPEEGYINSIVYYLDKDEKCKKLEKMIIEVKTVEDVINNINNYKCKVKDSFYNFVRNFKPLFTKKETEYIFKTKNVDEVMNYIQFYHRYYHLDYVVSVEKYEHKIKELISLSKKNSQTIEIIRKYLEFLTINQHKQQRQLEIRNLLKKYMPKECHYFDDLFNIVFEQDKSIVIDYLAGRFKFSQAGFHFDISQMKNRKDIVDILNEVFIKIDINQEEVYEGNKIEMRDVIKELLPHRINQLQQFNLLKEKEEPFTESENSNVVVVNINIRKLMNSYPMEKIRKSFYESALELWIDFFNNSKSDSIKSAHMNKDYCLFHLKNDSHIKSEHMIEMLHEYFVQLEDAYTNIYTQSFHYRHFTSATFDKEKIIEDFRLDEHKITTWIKSKLEVIELEEILVSHPTIINSSKI